MFPIYSFSFSMYSVLFLQSFHNRFSDTVPTKLPVSLTAVSNVQNDIQAFFVIGTYLFCLLIKLGMQKIPVPVGITFVIMFLFFIFSQAFTIILF